MGCCAGSLVVVNNTTGLAIEITDFKVGPGVLLTGQKPSAISAQANSTIEWSVDSEKNSQGRVGGKVFAKVMSGTPINFELPFSFQPTNDSGDCPCFANAGDAVKNGNFKAVASTSNGDVNKRAVVTWMITSTWA